MPLTKKTTCRKSHEVDVILGTRAVNAYLAGEQRAEALRSLGGLQKFKFLSIREMNAFILGVDIGSEATLAIAVDDLE